MSTPHPSNTEVIAPNGDFTLKAGGENGAKFKVSSARLCESSISMRDLVNHYLPLQPRATGELDFPDDNPDAMREILKMLHLRPLSHQVKVWPTDLILDFAISLKRYDLVDHLRYQTHAILSDWFRCYGAEASLIVVGDMVAAAFLLDHKHAFFQGTRQLMRLCTGDIADLAETRCGRNVPAQVLAQLERTRQMAHYEATYSLGIFLDYYCQQCGEAPAPDVDHELLYEHAHRHFGTETWPPPLTGDNAMCLQAVIDRTRILSEYSYTSGCEEHRTPGIIPTADFRALATQAERLSNGLCLTCVQAFAFETSAKCHDPAHFD